MNRISSVCTKMCIRSQFQWIRFFCIPYFSAENSNLIFAGFVVKSAEAGAGRPQP